MSEADVIRDVLAAQRFLIAQPNRLEALAALDSLTTRLAEVTNRMHVLQAQLDDSATRRAELERERDEAREDEKTMAANYDRNRGLWATKLMESESQLTQAREALERVRGEVRQHYAACDHDDRPASLALRNVANEALATTTKGRQDE